MTTFKKLGADWVIQVEGDRAKTLTRGSFLMVEKKNGSKKRVKVTEVIRNKNTDFGILCRFVEA